MSILRTLPVNFFEGSTNPVDPFLFEAVNKFCDAEFGQRLNLYTQAKVWALVEGEEVVGLTTMQMTPDIPTFHVSRGSDSEEHRERARKGRDLLTNRLVSFTQDNWGCGKEVHVFVDPSVERFWKPFLRLVRARPANRVIVTS